MYASLQGNVGLGKAIEYFTSNGMTVCLPLNDTQPYDLVVDFQGTLKKIQVKTSIYSKNGGSTYQVGLRNSGGNSTKSRYVPFSADSCDYLFIYTGANKTYLIPTTDITVTSAITVGNRYTEFEVFTKSLKDFEDEYREYADP